MKYALIAGAVTGGGLTVIANAPNPAGYGILNSAFGNKGIQAQKLFLAALGPTLIAGIYFGVL
jgi:Na+/H+ antiporter NhaD/arsenite permease-like protein